MKINKVGYFIRIDDETIEEALAYHPNGFYKTVNDALKDLKLNSCKDTKYEIRSSKPKYKIIKKGKL